MSTRSSSVAARPSGAARTLTAARSSTSARSSTAARSSTDARNLKSSAHNLKRLKIHIQALRQTLDLHQNLYLLYQKKQKELIFQQQGEN